MCNKNSRAGERPVRPTFPTPLLPVLNWGICHQCGTCSRRGPDMLHQQSALLLFARAKVSFQFSLNILLGFFLSSQCFLSYCKWYLVLQIDIDWLIVWKPGNLFSDFGAAGGVVPTERTGSKAAWSLFSLHSFLILSFILVSFLFV